MKHKANAYIKNKVSPIEGVNFKSICDGHKKRMNEGKKETSLNEWIWNVHILTSQSFFSPFLIFSIGPRHEYPSHEFFGFSSLDLTQSIHYHNVFYVFREDFHPSIWLVNRVTMDQQELSY